MLPEHAENPCVSLFVDPILGPVKAELRKDADMRIQVGDPPTFTINVTQNNNLTEPVLVTSFSQACSLFGNQTFDKSWPLFDEQTFSVLKWLRHGACYIVVKNQSQKVQQ